MLEWIFKLSGGGFIILSGFLISFIKTNELKKRVRIIDGLISGFVTAEGHICGRLITADEALSYAVSDASDAADIFKAAKDSGGNMRERFSHITDYLSKEDADAVLQYVNGICAPDDSDRRTAFALLRERLSVRKKQAEEDCLRLCRLYNTAGVLGGIVIVILLL